MLRKRFSAALIALIVTMAMPAGAFAGASFGEVTSDDGLPAVTDGNGGDAQQQSGDTLIPMEGQAGNTVSSSDEATPGDAEQTPEDCNESEGEEQLQAPEQPKDSEQPDDGQQSADEQPSADSEQSTDEQQPTEPPADEQSTADSEQAADQHQPTGEEPAEPEVPAVVPEDGEVPEAPPIVEEEILPEEVLPEELLEEVIAEPMPATLTIVQRLIVGETESEFVQMIDGLEVGQVVDLADYIIRTENVLCISDGGQITLSEENMSVILEYNLLQEDEFKNSDK